MKKRRLLIAGAVPPPFGGVASLVQGLVESEVLRDDFEVHHLNTSKTSEDLFQSFTFANTFRSLRQAAQLAGALARRRFGVVQLYCSSPISSVVKGIVLCAVARMFGARVVLDVHSPDFDAYYANASSPVRWLIRRGLRAPHAIRVASSYWQGVISPLLGARSDDVVTIPNCVNADAITVRPGPEEPGKVRVLFVGSLGERKGAYDLFEVLPSIAQEFPDTVFDIYGDPETPAVARDLEAFRARLSTDRIRSPGGIEYRELLKTYGRYDLFLFPSHAENFPICVLEAMAAGLPIITTPVGAIPDILKEEGNALLVEPGNRQQIGDALRRLIREPGLREAMGKRNRALVLERFDRRVVHDQIRDLYQRLLYGKHAQEM